MNSKLLACIGNSKDFLAVWERHVLVLDRKKVDPRKGFVFFFYLKYDGCQYGWIKNFYFCLLYFELGMLDQKLYYVKLHICFFQNSQVV